MAKKNNRYLINGKSVPSVTTVLSVIAKPELDQWKARVGHANAEKIKNDAADFGSSVHGAIEAVCNGQSPSYSNERLEKVMKNFEVWNKNNINKWIVFEKAIFHDDLLYAGTLDAIVELKSGSRVLLDIKTSKSIWPEYHLQLAAYANATRIEDNVYNLKKLDGNIILHLDHESLTWEGLNIHLTNEFDVFKSALELYKWKNSG